MARCQRGFNHSLLLPKQSIIECDCWASDLGRFPLEPCLVHRKSIAVAQDNGPLNHVLQFANVTRPAIRLEKLESFSIDGFELLSRLLSEAINKVLDKQRNVSCAPTQRGHLNGDDIQSV